LLFLSKTFSLNEGIEYTSNKVNVFEGRITALPFAGVPNSKDAMLTAAVCSVTQLSQQATWSLLCTVRKLTQQSSCGVFDQGVSDVCMHDVA
jgi:hypothetical protein